MDESDIGKIQAGIDELVGDIRNELDAAEYNDKKLFEGSSETTFTFQTGANAGQLKCVKIALDTATIDNNLNLIVANKNTKASETSKPPRNGRQCTGRPR